MSGGAVDPTKLGTVTDATIMWFSKTEVIWDIMIMPSIVELNDTTKTGTQRPAVVISFGRSSSLIESHHCSKVTLHF